jgi:hypothetical protein
MRFEIHMHDVHLCAEKENKIFLVKNQSNPVILRASFCAVTTSL